MPALKVKLLGGSTYWVAREGDDGLYVHDPIHHVMDFGMIRLYGVDKNSEKLVDRAWPITAHSAEIDMEDARGAVLRYLVMLNKRTQSDIAELAEVIIKEETSAPLRSPHCFGRDEIPLLHLGVLAEVAFC